MSAHWCSSKFKTSGLTVLAITACTILVSCTVPNDGQQSYSTHWAIDVVSTDGRAHWRISDGGEGPLCADSGVVFTQGNGQLYKVQYDGSNLTELYPGQRWNEHAISPKNKKVLLTSASAFSAELYLMDANGTNLAKLGPPKGWYAWTRISPDLDAVVFYRDSSLATMNTDGTNLQYIWKWTNSASATFALYIDETHILYEESSISNFTYTYSLRLFNTMSREDKLVGVHAGGFFPIYGRPVFGPNFLIGGADGMKVFNVYTSTFQTVGQGSEPSYSSDGSRIVVNRGSSIVTMNSDGSNAQTIYSATDSTWSLRYPQFSPDGRYVVFEVLWSVRLD